MKTIILFIVLAIHALGAVDLNKPISELKLKDGRTLKNVLVVGFASSAVTAKWDGGRGTIAYELFPAEYSKELESHRPKPC